ncbi:YybH family protein [Gemmatimonadota bacterium]
MSAETRAAIEAVDNAFMTMFGNGDAAGLAGLYTPDGQLLPPNSDFVTGQEAIQVFWQVILDMGLTGIRLETAELTDLDDTALEIGRYTLFAGDDNIADSGKYVVFWKNLDGEWKLHRDMWNTSAPAE